MEIPAYVDYKQDYPGRPKRVESYRVISLSDTRVGPKWTLQLIVIGAYLPLTLFPLDTYRP